MTALVFSNQPRFSDMAETFFPVPSQETYAVERALRLLTRCHEYRTNLLIERVEFEIHRTAQHQRNPNTE